MPDLLPPVLLAEYDTIIAEVGAEASDAQIVDALREHDWTEAGANAVLNLAQMYGTSILRNALALAHSMGIEDGEAGF